MKTKRTADDLIKIVENAATVLEAHEEDMDIFAITEIAESAESAADELKLIDRDAYDDLWDALDIISDAWNSAREREF